MISLHEVHEESHDIPEDILILLSAIFISFIN